MAFEVRSEILKSIAEEDDRRTKTVLLLLLGVLEANADAIKGLGEKIERLAGDRDGMRDAVLNGHADVHHEHHEWIVGRMASGCDEVCAWSRAKMDKEAEEAKEAADLVRAGKRAAVEQAVRTVVISAMCLAAGAIGMAHYLK